MDRGHHRRYFVCHSSPDHCHRRDLQRTIAAITNLALEGFQGVRGVCRGGFSLSLYKNYFASTPVRRTDLSVALAAMVGGALFAVIHAVALHPIHDESGDQRGVVINILLSVALTGFLTSQINQSVFGRPSDKFMLECLSEADGAPV